jgi:hypothetical protein
MSRTTLNVIYNLKEPKGDPWVGRGKTARRKLRQFGKRYEGFLKNTERPATFTYGTLCAWQTLIAGSSGDMVLTVNGVDMTTAFATSATVTATAMALAVNTSTDPLITGHVTAGNLATTIALSSCLPQGFITICGYTLRPVPKESLQDGAFEISGDNTADGDALVTAINAMPGLNDLIIAVNSSGTVTIRARVPAASLPINQVTKSGTSGITLGAGVMAATSTVVLSAVHKGIPGNTITCALTGTGSSIAGARLAGGTSTSVAFP